MALIDQIIAEQARRQQQQRATSQVLDVMGLLGQPVGPVQVQQSQPAPVAAPQQQQRQQEEKQGGPSISYDASGLLGGGAAAGAGNGIGGTAGMGAANISSAGMGSGVGSGVATSPLAGGGTAAGGSAGGSAGGGFGGAASAAGPYAALAAAIIGNEYNAIKTGDRPENPWAYGRDLATGKVLKDDIEGRFSKYLGGSDGLGTKVASVLAAPAFANPLDQWDSWKGLWNKIF